MLSIGKMVARSEDYYLRTVAAGREEYYTGAGESPGYWLGQGAERLGLSGQVAAGDLKAILAGISPEGQTLGGGGVASAKRVAGFDLTFSAPKSVSLLYGLSERANSARVRAAHAEAVGHAIDYLEHRALRLRRGHGGLEHEDAKGMVAAAFVHRTSRAGDPQLHTHVLVANVAEGADGVWSAPDARLLYAHARTAGYLYQATLRARLSQDLGVRFGPVERGMAELEGMPKKVLRAFSTRRREIEGLLSAGEHSRRDAEAAALATRSAKEVRAGLSGPGLRRRWLERAAELGLDIETPGGGPFAHLFGVDDWSSPRPDEIDDLVARLVGPHGLTEARSTFERRDVVRAVAEGLSRGSFPRRSRRLRTGCWPIPTWSTCRTAPPPSSPVTPLVSSSHSSASSSEPPGVGTASVGAWPRVRPLLSHSRVPTAL